MSRMYIGKTTDMAHVHPAFVFPSKYIVPANSPGDLLHSFRVYFYIFSTRLECIFTSSPPVWSVFLHLPHPFGVYFYIFPTRFKCRFSDDPTPDNPVTGFSFEYIEYAQPVYSWSPSEVKNTLETSGEGVKNTLEASGEDVKNTLETGGEDVKTTLETSG